MGHLLNLFLLLSLFFSLKCVAGKKTCLLLAVCDMHAIFPLIAIIKQFNECRQMSDKEVQPTKLR